MKSQRGLRRDPLQWCECAAMEGLYIRGVGERCIKGSKWELLFETAGDCLGRSLWGRPEFKTQPGLFGEESNPQGSLRCE